MSGIIKAYYICYVIFYKDVLEEEILCDKCDNYHCEECSYTFSIHYQHQGSRCYLCADQRRRKILTKIEQRDNKLKLYLQPGKICVSR